MYPLTLSAHLRLLISRSIFQDSESWIMLTEQKLYHDQDVEYYGLLFCFPKLICRQV